MSNISTMSQDPYGEEHQASMAKGARACTVCRAVKMKCVGADIKSGKPCDRCTKQGHKCIFEQHRRGRKPGSVLSESSKVLRRLEKRHGTGKAKGGALQVRDMHWLADNRATDPSTYPPQLKAASPVYDDLSDEEDRISPLMTPAILIKEGKRQTSHELDHSPDSSSWSTPVSATDPVSAGVIDEATARSLFDLFFRHISQSICLFDPVLHSLDYVRSRSRFLLSVLLMASCKFFKPEVFHQCQKLARELAAHALAEGWKSVEVVQAFLCLCYWEEPEDTRRWTYIGHACRMAIDIGMNRRGEARLDCEETEVQRRERRNRERAYLVLVMHDRSLAMHTGLPWMLPESDEIVRNGHLWHEQCIDESLRPNDILLSAVVQVRWGIIETTEALRHSRSTGFMKSSGVKSAERFQSSNEKLVQWAGFWEDHMKRAGGKHLHMTILKCMWLYVRVLINSSYIGNALADLAGLCVAVTTSYESAMESLRIAYRDFAAMNVLRYVQDSLIGKNAYCAALLVRLLRRPDLRAFLHDNVANDIYQALNFAAHAYKSAAASSPACRGLTHQVHFLRTLLLQDVFGIPPSVYTTVPPPQQEQLNQWEWAAEQHSTSGCDSVVYTHPWNAGAYQQPYPHPTTPVQGSSTLYAAHAAVTSVDYQPYWEQTSYQVESRGAADFGVHTYANQGGW